MTSRIRVLVGGLVLCTLAVGLVIAFPLARRVRAQTPTTGYENLLLCSLPGATKAEALSATGVQTLFASTFTVRVRNWTYLSGPKLWHGEWWLRDSTGTFAWVPVSTSMPCNFYPYDMDLDWIR